MKHAVCIGQFQNGIMSVISSAMVVKEPKGITTSIAFQTYTSTYWTLVDTNVL